MIVIFLLFFVRAWAVFLSVVLGNVIKFVCYGLRVFIIFILWQNYPTLTTFISQFFVIILFFTSRTLWFFTIYSLVSILQEINKSRFLLHLICAGGIYGKIIMCHHWSMICKINGLYIIIIQLVYVCVPFPQYTITKRWHSLLFTRVVTIAPQIIFISRHECNHTFLKLFEKHILIFIVQGFLRITHLIKCYYKIILIKQFIYIFFLYAVHHFLPCHGINSKIQITQQYNLIMIFYGHASVP